VSGSVAVLLSSYNGASYLPVQLDSILAQSHRNLVVRVRDDGSTDGTRDILRAYEASHPSIRVDYGTHLGVVPSFFALLAGADGDREFFAFADQDDFWPPAKVENAVAALSGRDPDRPLLYCSAVEYVDARLNHLGASRAPKPLGFGNALVDNAAIGATVVINAKARSTVLARMPRNALMHDWWLYLVVSALGEVIYDPRPGLKYRQHSANVRGWPHGFRYTVLQALVNMCRPYRVSPTVTDQASDFLACHGSALDPHRRDLLAAFLASHRDLLSRTIYAARMRVWRQSRIENWKLRAQLIAGRY
jgi:glycosyltransferase involved in cell wall biosynthesis